jgi:hypothetical protein
MFNTFIIIAWNRHRSVLEDSQVICNNAKFWSSESRNVGHSLQRKGGPPNTLFWVKYEFSPHSGHCVSNVQCTYLWSKFWQWKQCTRLGYTGLPRTVYTDRMGYFSVRSRTLTLNVVILNIKCVIQGHCCAASTCAFKIVTI